MQFQADLLGVPVVQPKSRRLPRSARIAAGLAVGYWKDQTTIAAQWGAEHTFKPGMRKGARSGLRARWKKALRRAKGWADK
jgi:glycerol kinase